MFKTKALDTFQAREMEFKMTREPHEIDVVGRVREMLIANGLQKEVLEKFDTNPSIQMVRDKKPEPQRHALNRFWNLQLIAFGSITIEHRFWLVPDGSIEDWLKIFEGRIVPFAVEHRLPA